MLTTHQQVNPQVAMLRYYDGFDEAGRLLRPESELERVRTRSILSRFLPQSPAIVLDVGGGPAVHSFWMADNGYGVTLVDIVPKHVQQALATQLSMGTRNRLEHIRLGDARQLDAPDASVDAVVCLGPLYHLTEASDRALAISEAYRVLRSGGVLIAGGISRYVYAIKTLIKSTVIDPSVAQMVSVNLARGLHVPIPGYDDFTHAYLHRPEELADEIRAGGFETKKLLAVEGPARLMGGFREHWQAPLVQSWLLEIVQAVEEDISIMGLSGHFIVVARKP